MTVINDTFIAPPCSEQIDVLYEDHQIVIINKPSGLLSLSGKILPIWIRSITDWSATTPVAA